jgi:hypothetical protein
LEAVDANHFAIWQEERTGDICTSGVESKRHWQPLAEPPYDILSALRQFKGRPVSESFQDKSCGIALFHIRRRGSQYRARNAKRGGLFSVHR